MALGALLFTGFAAAGSPAFAEVVSYGADLSGGNEVPPNDVKGPGKVEAKYDTSTQVLSWTVTYAGTSGPVVAAHFHGPAAAGANAAPAITLPAPLASPIKGEQKLTPDQAKQLEDGLWYLNLHTAANKGGELRGQLKKQ